MDFSKDSQSEKSVSIVFTSNLQNFLEKNQERYQSRDERCSSPEIWSRFAQISKEEYISQTQKHYKADDLRVPRYS